MFTRIAIVAMCLLFDRGLAQAEDRQPTYLALGNQIDWKLGALADKYLYSDQQGRQWTINLRTQGKVGGKPKHLKMTVSAEGTKPQSVTFDIESAADFGTLGVYEFDPQWPAFVLTDYTLGAHCCTEVSALIFNGQKLVPVDGGTYDGSGISVRDLDGDGTYEIETWDQRFYYSFDSYAGSLPARQILKLRLKGTEDDTENPQYASYLLGEVRKWSDECYNNPSPGICAGALATAAKAGLYQSVAADVDFNKIDADNPKGEYLSCSKERCGVEMKFWNFREALEFQLNDWGYKTDSAMTDGVRAYFRKLAAYKKGFGPANDVAKAYCSDDGVKFTMDKAAQYVRMEGTEYACRIERARILDNTAVSIGLCAAEGTSYSTLLVTELTQDKLNMMTVDNGAMNVDAVQHPLSACR